MTLQGAAFRQHYRNAIPEQEKMRKFLLTTAALALLTTTAHAEKASVGIPLYAGGFWKTTQFARNTKGNPQCTMAGNWKFANGASGMVQFKYANDFGMFVHFGKSSWSLPTAVNVKMAIEFDGIAREGMGRTIIAPTSGWSMIEVRVQQAAAVKFVEDLAAADKMVITFKDGNEPPWLGKMDGARKAAVAFMKCVAEMPSTLTSPLPQAQAPVSQEPGMTPVVPETPAPAPALRPFGSVTSPQPIDGKGI
jgi:hypothetical protein